jgi:hypothetical protein
MLQQHDHAGEILVGSSDAAVIEGCSLMHVLYKATVLAGRCYCNMQHFAVAAALEVSSMPTFVGCTDLQPAAYSAIAVV